MDGHNAHLPIQEDNLMISLPNLHDATLKSVNFDWVRGVVQLAFKTDVAFSSVIEANEVTELKCPSFHPGGQATRSTRWHLQRLLMGTT